MSKQPKEKPTMQSHQVLAALQKKHTNDYFLTEVKTGPTQYVGSGTLQKLDGLAIAKSWANPCFSGYEVKVSRSDFIGDTKWANYRNYCHRFSFACPSGLIKPEELPDDVGLVWVNEQGGWSVRRAALFRPIEIPWEMLYYIIMSKLDDERYPFFGGKHEYFKAYLEDRNEGYRLSRLVSQKWAAQLKAMEEKVAAAERKVAEVDGLMKAADILQQHGINVRVSSWGLDWELKRLEERLSGSLPTEALNELYRAQGALERVVRLVKPKAPDEGPGDAA